MASSELKIKEDAKLNCKHFLPGAAKIIATVDKHWPDGYYVMITRGSEAAKGGAANSKHFLFKAFDFRTWHLSPSVDRKKLLKAILDDLGPKYCGYYGDEVVNGTRVNWYHIQFDG